MKSINMNVFWMTAEEALAKLGTKPQTLYANVSRGRIRAKPDPADPRRSRYHSDDILRLAERHSGRRQADVVAAQAIRWGDPILPTSISKIAEGRLFYRGFEASDLSASATLEDIAKLLWQAPNADFSAGKAELQHLSRLAVAMRSLADRVTEDPPSIDRTPEALRAEAADVLSTVAAGLAPSPDQMPMHQRLATGWRRPEAAEPIRKSLVLAAEHELNVSAFAARVTASSGASLSAATLSGLVTLTGPRHGGAWLSVMDLVRQASLVGAREAVQRSMPFKGALRAFGHPLYPRGDPRAKVILSSFEMPAIYASLAIEGEDLLGEPPNIDFALAALAATFDLPDDAPLVIFALARTVGWLAHALEQVESGHMIRPRAHYSET